MSLTQSQQAMTPAEVSALRHAMGLSLDGLARMLDVNPRTGRSWESGRDGLSASSEAAVRELAGEHEALVQLMLRSGPVSIRRSLPAGATPPRGWFLAAAGRALMIDPSVDVQWV